MGIGSSNVYRWVNEIRDPNSETVVRIVEALESIEPNASEEFRRLLYLGDATENDQSWDMGRAGKALKQTLETYDISQNRLAVVLGVERNKVFRWFHEQVDPTAETVADIVKALNQVNPAAANTFIDLYLGELVERSRDES